MDSLLQSSAVTIFGLAACVLVLSVSLLRNLRKTDKALPVPRASTPGEKEKGEIRPFKTPLPEPARSYKLELTEPKLYRPFRHGKNFVTMGIRKMDWNEWIEMDSNFVRYHDIKVKQLDKDIDAHVGYVDNEVTRLACFEVYEELTQYLTHRFPEMFSLKDGTLRNSVTKEEFPYPASTPKEAMATSAKLIQDDIALMVMNDDGQYHLDAGAVCLPGFWRLKEKFRMSLDTLHIEAGVPHYQEKLMKSMNRFFARMTPDQPVIRNNFFIQLDDGLHWSHRMGDEKNVNQVASWANANSKDLTIDEIHFRSERQSLRRLPKSGALMFTIRTYFEPITVIAQEPHVPGRLAEAIRAWDGTVSHYKGRSHWEGLMLPYLDEMHRKQEESGALDTEEGEFPF
ncbi:hypothetical protein DPSP01_010899 [Paraphaeosphaeria sporulosa]|uniref:HRQ family protein 2 n=1 Tax=Paraphaeosphaeria sporulosa TaxID=1460663 RepID=A0A177C3F5_9PLEO|nr:uncharacterized protein CC84DRAFT_1167619 [Paraphaeosphaeria sporulosa]OAG01412.1 hypothetical protein CC84DRAFT_1167619 [Paraphaeosphaeria sporulosa]